MKIAEGVVLCAVCRGCTSLRWSVRSATSPRSSLTRSCTCPCHCRPPRRAPCSSPSSMLMAPSCPSPMPLKFPRQVCLAFILCHTAADWISLRGPVCSTWSSTLSMPMSEGCWPSILQLPFMCLKHQHADGLWHSLQLGMCRNGLLLKSKNVRQAGQPICGITQC